MTKQGEIVFILEKRYFFGWTCVWILIQLEDEKRTCVQTYNLSQNVKSLKSKDNDSECLMDK